MIAQEIMNTNGKTITIWFLITSLMISGCGSEQLFSSTLTPTMMNTSAPTRTPLPTDTPAKTPTSPISTPLPDYTELIALFDYDKAVPLDVNWGSKEQQDTFVRENVVYMSDGCKVYAFLVSPNGPGPYPAVIYVHMGQANKNQYLSEAAQLAEHGVVSLLLDAPFLSGCGNSSRDYYNHIVINIRRGIDLLETIPKVNPEKIGYVGHSFGATWGGVMAGVDARIKAYVLIAGYARVSQHDAPDFPDLDAILYIGHNTASSFLFQFSTGDDFISESEAWQYYNAANEPKKILWYDSTHAGLQEVGQVDRINWLGKQLGFD